MRIVPRSLTMSTLACGGCVGAQQRAVIDLSRLVQPEARILIVTPAHGAQPPPAA